MSLSLFSHIKERFGDTIPMLRCTKATLVHISHTIEDLVLTRRIPAVLLTGFQESSHWREETERYRAIATIAQQVCIFAGGTLPPESLASEVHVTLSGDDPLRQEWFLVLLASDVSVLLCGQDRHTDTADEATRQFDTFWSFKPDLINGVLDILEETVAHYRPDRLADVRAARQAFPPTAPDPDLVTQLTGELIRFEEDLHQRLSETAQRLNNQIRWRESLLATLVHDMRTPLTAIRGSLDIFAISKTAISEDMLFLFEGARRGVQNITGLIDTILDTNKLEDQQFSVQMSYFPISEWLKNFKDVYESLAQQHRISFETVLHPSVTHLWADPVLLQRVIENLLSNAIKFTKSGGKISLIIAPAPKPHYVELRVRDTGAGIDPDIVPHIFDRYFQASKRDRRGYGLGLYFSKLATEAQGGKIGIQSTLGMGTTITVTLPSRPNIS